MNKCMACDNDKEVQYLPIYAFGSEGVNLCLQCRIVLSTVVRGMVSLGQRKLLEHKKRQRS